MRTFAFETLDVFTERQFGGNPLAVFVDGRGISDAEMQSLAAEMNLSETTFVLPPADPANTARVRIFNRTAEMAFAGHPVIGTAVVLARGLRGQARLALEVPAGIAVVEIERDADGAPVGGVATAPQPLSLGEAIDAETVAECLGLAPDDIVQGAHPPRVASCGNPYVIAQVATSVLARCVPNLPAFRAALAARPQLGTRFSLHVYAHDGASDEIEARMFAPLAGTWEDPATGSANAPLGGFLLSLTDALEARFVVRQGHHMGRPSVLAVRAWRDGEAIRCSVGGRCAPMFRGEARLG